MQPANLPALLRDRSRPSELVSAERRYAQGEVEQAALDQNDGIYQKGHQAPTVAQLLTAVLVLDGKACSAKHKLCHDCVCNTLCSRASAVALNSSNSASVTEAQVSG